MWIGVVFSSQLAFASSSKILFFHLTSFHTTLISFQLITHCLYHLHFPFTTQLSDFSFLGSQFFSLLIIFITNMNGFMCCFFSIIFIISHYTFFGQIYLTITCCSDSAYFTPYFHFSCYLTSSTSLTEPLKCIQRLHFLTYFAHQACMREVNR
jgi:hypothetical protein